VPKDEGDALVGLGWARRLNGLAAAVNKNRK
jgi:hypothetical protein